MVAAMCVASAGGAFAALPIYETSFESPTYTAGNSVNNVDGWTVSTAPSNDVTVTSGGAPGAGSQYLVLSGGSDLSRTIANTDNKPLLWVEGYFRGEGSSFTLDQATYNMTDASAIVHFSSAQGIQMMDGVGDGNKGATVNAGVALGPNNASTWFKVTIQLNFVPNQSQDKTWKIWVNDIGRPSGNQATLKFRNNTVTKLNGFRNLAEQQSSFDAFRVVEPQVGDANGDARVDSADLIALIDYLANNGLAPNIILQTDADLNGDEALTSADRVLLEGILIGLLEP